MDMNEKKLNALLAAGRTPDADISLLRARILKAALDTPQDGHKDSRVLPIPYKNFAVWKSIAATLILTTGIGFSFGQTANENTAYASAEALLSMSFNSDYDETNLDQNPEQDLTGEQP